MKRSGLHTALALAALTCCLLLAACAFDDAIVSGSAEPIASESSRELSEAERQTIYKDLVAAEVEADMAVSAGDTRSIDVLTAVNRESVIQQWDIEETTAKAIEMQGSAEEWPIWQ